MNLIEVYRGIFYAVPVWISMLAMLGVGIGIGYWWRGRKK
jgi:hypothetical protein